MSGHHRDDVCGAGLGVLDQFAGQDGEFRVIAGNTGAGVYHDWPLERVLVDIKGIPDLTRVEYSKASKGRGSRVSCCFVLDLAQKQLRNSKLKFDSLRHALCPTSASQMFIIHVAFTVTVARGFSIIESITHLRYRIFHSLPCFHIMVMLKENHTSLHLFNIFLDCSCTAISMFPGTR